MSVSGLFLAWQMSLIVLIVICLTSFRGEVTKDDINNIFLPIGPNIDRLDQNIKLVEAIRYLATIFGIGMVLLVGLTVLLEIIE